MVLPLIISTVERKPTYLDQTLASLLLSDYHGDIHLMLDSDRDFLPYQAPRLRKYIRNSIEGWTNSKKATHNYCRCLSLFQEFIVCEDDLLFKYDWHEQFQACLDQIKTLNLPRFALSLAGWPPVGSSPFDRYPVKLQFENKLYSQVYAEIVDEFLMPFTGTFGVYFSEGGWQDLTGYLLASEGVVKYDLLLGHFFSQNQIPLFATNQHLIEHVGIETSI